MSLIKYGWDEEWEVKASAYFSQEKELVAGRVTREHKGLYQVWTEEGAMLSEVSGKYRFDAVERRDYPAVGDWVLLAPRTNEGKATIHKLLPRKSCFSRKEAGTVTNEQIVAANIDTVFLVMALNQDFNVRRLERYMTMSWESGANPVIILSKADLCEDLDEKILEVEGVAYGVPVHVVSVVKNEGLDQLVELYIGEGKSVALLGSSGVGKSTIINALLGEEVQEVKDIREDDAKGRHTTTHRELFVLPEGGILVDTPGMRELQLWGSDEGYGFQHSFVDIEGFGRNCRFRDCMHNDEPGCAIQLAIETGDLDQSRFESYKKLQRELAYIEKKAEGKARIVEKQRGKQHAKWIKQKKKWG
ncbi:MULTISPECIES: ribosome small subunit-dependent GTPase A [Bacillaceae]|uniref:Small ribosomal subunit biogenesis GTPase RsgA n=1 Tax=Evansella alkalicola TaxID=745819 RepID=A0ABS6JS31_9BACI|nr:MULTISPECIES: ribosome small subunit-dependent GTPase A [Bacillaceae]MBU9721293.1 ribosome small subunit-dependent GTPase A [Bacillus alkalicola]